LKILGEPQPLAGGCGRGRAQNRLILLLGVHVPAGRESRIFSQGVRIHYRYGQFSVPVHSHDEPAVLHGWFPLHTKIGNLAAWADLDVREKGIFRLQMGHYFAYFLPHFRPAKFGETRGCERWIAAFKETNDLIVASEALKQSKAGNKK
jgi:hypothetical protein